MTDGTGVSSGVSGSRFHGLYRGTVTDNQDPLQTGRIRVQVPEVTGEADSQWATLCVPFGIVSIPPVGAGVLIQFEQGDPDRPFVMGSVWNASVDTATLLLAPPYRDVVIQTKGGHQIILDDAPGTGGITLRTATGQIIVLSCAGAEIGDGAGGSVQLTAPQAAIEDNTPQ
jgi:uncharacterized protein involved in type VI secretion and phage assembly